LTVGFDDGVTFQYSAEYLRVFSQAATPSRRETENQEVIPFAPKTLVANRRGVGITGIEHVGSYAILLVRFLFLFLFRFQSITFEPFSDYILMIYTTQEFIPGHICMN
jgi:hypothetical protein